MQEYAAEVFHAEETHYLVNGSTVGLLSAVLGCTGYGDRILMARNCHKSVYNAVDLNGLIPEYVYPEFDETTVLMERSGRKNRTDHGKGQGDEPGSRNKGSSDHFTDL